MNTFYMLPPGETPKPVAPKLSRTDTILGYIGILWILLGTACMVCWLVPEFFRSAWSAVQWVSSIKFPSVSLSPGGMLLLVAVIAGLLVMERLFDSTCRTVGKAAKTFIRAFDNRDN